MFSSACDFETQSQACLTFTFSSLNDHLDGNKQEVTQRESPMDRKLDKKAVARALAAPAPMRKRTSTVPDLSRKRKAQGSHETPEHDLDFLSLLSPSLASAPSRSTKSASTKALASTRPRTGPEVVVFDGSKVDRKSSASAGGAEFNFKKFMSSKISKLDEVAPPQEKPLNAEEKAQELENKRNDTELHSLIKASRLLEQYNADHLDGVERRRHQRDQIINLGIQVEKSSLPFVILTSISASFL